LYHCSEHDQPAPVEIDVRAVDGAVVIALVGDLDIAGARRLQPCVDAALQSTVGGVVIDVGDLAFIDSSGIAALLAARERALESGRRFTLVRVGPQARRVFELGGVDDLLSEVEPSA
jgi:anti-sigma B factor antagonist